ncbi:MAG TPA: hypothetical protein RMH99_00330, partial [Sandaracinaceae bacterium LLY-WYZ-13_1]|nr:hypothetical protein [Sandaracinaceae bacterium LLY-WYZ-13_1]
MKPITFAIAATTLLSLACSGEMGDMGLNSLVDVSVEPAGDNCAAGGQRIDTGVDDDGDGSLDAEEIDSTAYVCDGEMGEMGEMGGG